MNTSSIRAFILDYDGLTVNTEELREESHAKLLKEHGRELVHQDYLPTMTQLRGREKVYGFYKKTYGLSSSIEELAQRAAELWKNLYPSRLRLQEGVVETIKEAKRLGLSVAIASNRGKESVMEGLNSLGIKDEFDLVVNSEDLDRVNGRHKGKPEPEIYLVTTNKLGLMPEKCLAFEDSVAGLRSAKDAGCRVVYVPDERYSPLIHPDADITYKSLRDFNFEEVMWIEQVFAFRGERVF